MKSHSQTISLRTTHPIEVIEMTDAVRSAVKKSGIADGLVLVASRHTTAGVRINEDCPELKKDLVPFLGKLADPKGDYRHNRVAGDGRLNAHSHLLSYLLGSSETVAVSKGELRLGAWQRIFFVELDGPRSKREVEVTVIGE